jgi:hypothetical protein
MRVGYIALDVRAHPSGNPRHERMFVRLADATRSSPIGGFRLCDMVVRSYQLSSWDLTELKLSCSQ